MTNEQIIELVKDTYPDLNILAITLIGSRTFGEPRNDSDYDIRFVYSRPVNDYITIDKVPEQTKQVVDHKIDLIGYDAQYFFRLLVDSNLTAVEFLRALMYNPIYTSSHIDESTYRFIEHNLNKKYIIGKYRSFLRSEVNKNYFERINTIFSHIKDVNESCHGKLKTKFEVEDALSSLLIGKILVEVEDIYLLASASNYQAREKLKYRCEKYLRNIMLESMEGSKYE